MDQIHLQHARPGCSIEDLSSELLFMIMDHLPPPTQFHLASTCKRLATAARGVLERHQESHLKYRTASDLNPSTVRLLLRSAFGQGDPIPAWHVRSFEVWKDRTTWSEWQTFDLHVPLVTGPNDKPSHLRVSREDVRRYLYWFEDHLGENLSFELIKKLLDQVDRGHDGLLKALLFARLERLEDLKFVTRSQEAGSCLTSLRTLIAECIRKKVADDEKEEANRKPCDCDNCTAERNEDSEDGEMQDDESDWDRMLDRIEKRALHSNSSSPPWPAGFLKIRKVAVGVTSRTWMDDNRDGDEVEPCTFLFSHLLRLPSLHSIYFSKLLGAMSDYEGDLDPEEKDCEYEVLPVGSSSVKHIFLHGCSGTFGENDEELWAGPRQLLTMSFRFAGSEEFDCATNAANSLARIQGDNLQSLMWYGYTGGYERPRNVVGDHCTILDNEEFDRFRCLPAMKHMSVCVNDMELYMHGYHFMRHNPEDRMNDRDEHGNSYDKKNHENFIVRRVATLFPHTLETLVLWDQPVNAIAEQIGQGLAKMIKGGRYKNLKAIFLEATENQSDQDCSAADKSWFQEAVKAGRDFGVDVYTLSNQEEMRHSLDFTEGPDEYDLKSGIHAGVRPGDWVFDPYLGRRIPPCSKAEQYVKLWKHLQSEREAFWATQRMEYANEEGMKMDPRASLSKDDRD